VTMANVELTFTKIDTPYHPVTLVCEQSDEEDFIENLNSMGYELSYTKELS
jgi:hypothetical protein